MDILIKALALNEKVRVYLASTVDITNEAVKRHDLWPSAASVLGKAMTIGVMMGSMLKGDEALTIKIDGNGPIGVVVVDANAAGEVRGYVTREHVLFDKKGTLDDVTTLGYNGFIDVIKDLKLKDLFTSTIPLQTGDLAKDFTYYFATSEQTPSLVSLGSLFDVNNQAIVLGGIIIQLLPDATEEDINYIESKVNILSSYSSLLKDNPDQEDILKLLFNDDYKIVEKKNISFRCNCSKEKFAGGIASLGKEEIEDMINTDKKAEVICHFCKEVYTFDENELREILKHAKGKTKNEGNK
ncbi:MAG: Hsp33 family molecular chaperone HslO [Bacilli bacterium]|nr:Hsp33 family molecular chaperone HslO [Bacilli bacterium]